jgi:two-component system response regulator FimZ (fimbrial Z protein)
MKRIVVIDDHPIVVKMLSNVLNAEYELAGDSGDGETGLRLVQTLLPDLVILDLELPKLDGLSLIRTIRSKAPRTRVLVLTAKPEQVMANHTRIAGANGYVNKNRGIEELRSVAKAVLLGYDCFPAGTVAKAAATSR